MRLVQRGAGGVVVLVVGVATAIASCSPSPPASSSVPAPTPSATRPDRGPLWELINFTVGGVDAWSPDAGAGFIAYVSGVEARIADCMAEEGFDYAPMVFSNPRVNLSGPSPQSREFAETYGFGIAKPPPDGGSYGFVTADIDSTANVAAYSTMTTEQRAAWDDALQGVVTEQFTDAQGVTHRSRTGGCWDVGYGGGDPVFTEATSLLGSLDPQADDTDLGWFDDINRDWSSCMRAEGYAYASPGEAREAVRVAQPGADEEIRIAVASWDCQAQTNYPERRSEISNRVQQEWIDDHQAELDAWVESVESW